MLIAKHINEFIFVCSSEKDFLFDCLHLNELVLLFGEQKQRDTFQFNGALNNYFCFFYWVFSFLIFILSFQVFIPFRFVLN